MLVGGLLFIQTCARACLILLVLFGIWLIFTGPVQFVWIFYSKGRSFAFQLMYYLSMLFRFGILSRVRSKQSLLILHLQRRQIYIPKLRKVTSRSIILA